MSNPTSTEQYAETKLSDLTALTIQTGDMVVIKLPEEHMDGTTIEGVRQYIEAHFDASGIQASCLIIPNTADVSVLRPAQKEDAEVFKAERNDAVDDAVRLAREELRG